jgi:hypothetical protein
MAWHGLLGHEGYISGDKFWIAHVHAAVRFVRDNIDHEWRAEANQCDETWSDSDTDEDNETDEHGEGDGNDGDEDLDDDDHRDSGNDVYAEFGNLDLSSNAENPMGPEAIDRAEEGFATMHSVANVPSAVGGLDENDADIVGSRRVFRLEQHVAYLYRGPELQTMNLYEYTAMVTIQRTNKQKEPKKRPENEDERARGRTPNETYAFSENAPVHLRSNFVQQLRSMSLTPILGGGNIPSKHFSQEFMEYYLALFEPWVEEIKGPPIPPRRRVFKTWLSTLADAPLHSVLWHRGKILLRAASKRIQKKIIRIQDRHRTRARTYWNSEPDGIPDRVTDGLPKDDAASRREQDKQTKMGHDTLKVLRSLHSVKTSPGLAYDQSRGALISHMCGTPKPLNAIGLARHPHAQHAVGSGSNPESADALRLATTRTHTLAARSAYNTTHHKQDAEAKAAIARQRVADVRQRLTSEDNQRGFPTLPDGSTATAAPGNEGGLPQDSALLTPEEEAAPIPTYGNLQTTIDFQTVWNREENRTLSPEQKRVIQIVYQYVVDKDTHDVNPTMKSCPAPFQVFVHGRGGLGKTTIIKRLIHELGPEKFKLMAPTGSAAKTLGGSTYHSALNIQLEDSNQVKRLGSEDIARLKLNFVSCQVVAIDLISMVGIKMFDAIMSRLRDIGSDKAHPFGGFTVLLLGDFFQMDPVLDTSLLKAFIDPCLSDSFVKNLGDQPKQGHSTPMPTMKPDVVKAPKNKKLGDRQKYRVGRALHRFLLIELRAHAYQRSKNDAGMALLQELLRNTSLDYPITDEIFNLLRQQRAFPLAQCCRQTQLGAVQSWSQTTTHDAP